MTELIDGLPCSPCVCCAVLSQVPMEALFPDANPLALDLLGKMMEFDQNRRISVDGALSHPYLMELHSKAKVRLAACFWCSL